MIRTSIVLSPRQNAGERLYLQANGLPVDMTAGSQSVVMTSHRPTQLYVASHAGQRQSGPTLTAQTGLSGQHMQRLMDLLDRQGSDILIRLCRDAELRGEWMVAFDENRLNAVLSERYQFYLFRDQRLRELRPVSELDMAIEPVSNRAASAGRRLPDAGMTGFSNAAADPASASSASSVSPESDAASVSSDTVPVPALVEPTTRTMYHFRIEIRQGDQVLVMPRGIFPPPLLGEAEAVLSGMQQMPDRLSALMVRLRERGVMGPFNGWLAVQVLRTLTEYVVTDKPQRIRFGGRRKGGEADVELGFSEEMPDAESMGRGASGVRWGLGRSSRTSSGAGGAAAGMAAATGSAAAAAGAAGLETGSATGSAAGSATGSAGYATGSAAASSGSGYYSERRSDTVIPWHSRTAARIVLAVVAVAIVAALAFAAYQFLRKPGAKQPVSTTTAVTTAATTTQATTTAARPTPTVTPQQTTTATTAPRVAWYVIARRVNVRAEPNSTSKLIRTLTIGQPVYVIEQTDKSWSKVQTAEGETGFVFTSYISKNKPAG